MGNKDNDKQRQQPQAGQQGQGGGRKNNEEVGEPVQLNEDMQKGQQEKPGMGQQQGGKQDQQQGGKQGGAQHPGQSDR